VARAVASIVGLYGLACALGFGLLVLCFQVGLLGGIDILFYRGLVLIVLAFLGTFGCLALARNALRRAGLGLRDAFAAAVLSLSLNLSFLIVVPVTVDRSISIFVLGEMAARPDDVFTPDAMSEDFIRVYVGEGRQIERRLREQAVSGNVVRDGAGYRISSRGKAVVATSRIVATLFGSHAGILRPEPRVSPPSDGPR
jgi:hypothetical protein